MTPANCTILPDQAASDALEAAINALPDRVAAMRERILAAAEAQDLNALRAAIERNEVMPLFGQPGKRPRRFSEAIDFLKAQSFDGQGTETCALLAAILNAPYAHHQRKPVDMYVWPAQAVDQHLMNATPPALVHRFVAFADLGRQNASGQPLLHRVEIGADGTWHFFAVA